MTAIRQIEELSMNAWPSLQTLLCDGWVLRFADGYTKRANSVNPLYPCSADVTENIQACESLYRSKNLPVVFKMTRQVFPDGLDALLQTRGYESDRTTSVQLLDLARIDRHSATSDMTEVLTDKWLEDYTQLSGVNVRYRSTLHQMLSSSCTSTGFFSIKGRSETIACGLGVVQDAFIGLFDIVTHADHRNRGYSQQLISDILTWGKSRGARTAYLQVMLNNPPALHLYGKLGFKEFYQYWYRISP